MEKKEIANSEEKYYSLTVAPKTEIAKALGNFRRGKRSHSAMLKELEIYLGLSHEEITQFEAGNFEDFNKASFCINRYMKFLGITVNDLYKDERYNVKMPILKAGAKGGTKNRLMVIDDYTTRFSSREALINDVIAENRTVADLTKFSDEDLSVLIQYPKFVNRLPLEIQYSENIDLIDFIRNNDYHSFFSPGNPYVEKLLREVKEVFQRKGHTDNQTEPEFRYFVNHNREQASRYYGTAIYAVEKWDKEGQINDPFIASILTYSALRGSTIMHTLFNRDRERIERMWRDYYDPENNREKPTVTKPVVTKLKVTDRAYDVVSKKQEDTPVEAEEPLEEKLESEEIKFYDMTADDPDIERLEGENGQLKLFDMPSDDDLGDEGLKGEKGSNKPKRSH